MATLIEVRKGGQVIGRCDAKCYDAKSKNCDCICDGVNHGTGLANAEANIARIREEWESFDDVKVMSAQIQMKLL